MHENEKVNEIKMNEDKKFTNNYYTSNFIYNIDSLQNKINNHFHEKSSIIQLNRKIPLHELIKDKL